MNRTAATILSIAAIPYSIFLTSLSTIATEEGLDFIDIIGYRIIGMFFIAAFVCTVGYSFAYKCCPRLQQVKRLPTAVGSRDDSVVASTICLPIAIAAFNTSFVVQWQEPSSQVPTLYFVAFFISAVITIILLILVLVANRCRGPFHDHTTNIDDAQLSEFSGSGGIKKTVIEKR